MENNNRGHSEQRWENPDKEDKSNKGGTYYPWRRFFARTIDLFFVSLIFIMAFALLGTIFFPAAAEGLLRALGNPLISGVVVYLFWVPIEAFFISRSGATPGKALFGIRVLSQSGQVLSYPDALQRTFLVWIKGDGLGIPIVAVVTRIFAYKRLQRTGTTLWDMSVGTVVTHSEFGLVRTILCALAISLAIGASAIFSLMGNV